MQPVEDGSATAVRGAQRVVFVDAALEPLEGELDPEEFEQLRICLCLLIGSGAMICLRDVLGYSREHARALGERADRHAVRAALAPR